MPIRATKAAQAGFAALVLVGTTGCEDAGGDARDEASVASADTPADRPRLGLMTSLPLYWPQGAGLADLASGEASVPWQRTVIERNFALVPLDTLSPIPGLSPDAPETDPLAGLDRLAIIQPRGLTPADNVALDDWVREGGQLLLVLDPMLTGEYPEPLGDPRRPVDAALVPPVVARWGLTIDFANEAERERGGFDLSGAEIALSVAGTFRAAGEGAERCEVHESGALSRCSVGSGAVTLLADAAVFEHVDQAGQDGAAIMALLALAFE